MGSKAGNHPSVSLPTLFANEGYSTTLVADEPLLNSFAGAADFDANVQVIAPSEIRSTNKRAGDPSNTDLARAFSAVSDHVGDGPHDKPRLVWFHSRGMYGPWNAPLALQQSLLDEGEPPVESVIPPDLTATAVDDPDATFRYACAYAAQVMVLDACWESLLDAMNSTADDDWLITLIGARGFPLGEHRRIGGIDGRTHAEQLQVPWLTRFPGKLGRLARSGMLTSHQDLLPTLVEWIDRDHKLDRSMSIGMSILPFATATRIDWRDAITSTSTTARSIRTAAWCLREDAAENGRAVASSETASTPELYVRPDDRWEANDVAKLCPEVVEELRAAVSDSCREAR